MPGLVTLAEAREYLKLGASYTTDDTFLTNLILRASAYVESIINRVLTSATYEEVYNGNGSNKLILNHFPVTAVQVVSDDIDNPTKQILSVLTTEYIIEPALGMLEGLETIFAYGNRNIYVRYTAGYTTIPQDIRFVVLDLVAKKYYDRDEKRQGVNSRNAGGDSISFSMSDITEESRKLLNKWKDSNLCGTDGLTVSGYAVQS